MKREELMDMIPMLITIPGYMIINDKLTNDHIVTYAYLLSIDHMKKEIGITKEDLSSILNLSLPRLNNILKDLIDLTYLEIGPDGVRPIGGIS